MTWLDDAVIYEIYPQSFADSNSDGIGDLPGVIDHLDHLTWLGVNAIWFNPCFASPFRDAGYDVSDYLQIAPRYGSNDDLVALCEAASARGIRVMLDLVAGHTSAARSWFVEESNRPVDGPAEGDRYVWRASPADGSEPGEPWVASPGARPGFYFKNFYDEQPALNFGYARPAADEPWRQRPDELGLRSGFDGDFFLVNQAAHSALFNNGGAGTAWWLPDHKLCFFDADGPDGHGSLGRFLALWDEHIAGNGPDRRVILATADHDYSRLHTGGRGLEQLPAAYAFLLTWGTVPSIYYGDEIGMRYLPGLPDLEGSICYPGYNRAGCRTPMQWNNALPNAGFSNAAPDRLYLPQDPDPNRPTIAAQLTDPHSLLHTVRRLMDLRAAHPALGAGSDQQVLNRDYPFAYLRGGTHLVVVNPRREPASVHVPELVDREIQQLEGTGVQAGRGRISTNAFGWGIFALE